MPDVILVLGGARSGKSAYAESLVEGIEGDPIYIATATPSDEEMAARIAAHKARRGDHWSTVEEPRDLTGVIAAHAVTGRAVLVDCLTLWLANVMADGADPESETGRLVETLRGAAAPVVLVSNEVGFGIVPDNALARAFRDHAGRLNQAVAAAADRVVFIAAGLPLTLK